MNSVRSLLMMMALTAVAAHAQSPATVQRVGDTIRFEGRIEPGSAARFLEMLREGGVKRLVIDSNGGIVSAGLDMADAILERDLDVEVPSNCVSSCANYVFPAGRRKTLGHPAAVAWHGNMTHVLYLEQSGQASWSEELLADARALARREADFFARAGVDGFVCWFGKIAPYNVADSYSLSIDDMARFGIRDVGLKDAASAASGGKGPALLAVDWPHLESGRPMVRPGR